MCNARSSGPAEQRSRKGLRRGGRRTGLHEARRRLGCRRAARAGGRVRRAPSSAQSERSATLMVPVARCHLRLARPAARRLRRELLGAIQERVQLRPVAQRHAAHTVQRASAPARHVQRAARASRPRHNARALATRCRQCLAAARRVHLCAGVNPIQLSSYQYEEPHTVGECKQLSRAPAAKRSNSPGRCSLHTASVHVLVVTLVV